MSHFSSRTAAVVFALVFSLGIVACSLQVGSDAWCEKMKEKDKAKWSAEDAGNFAKHCILK
jgi:hypothetical protein